MMDNCVFKKLPGDTIYDWAFHNQHYYQGSNLADGLYNGDYLVRLYPGDSSGQTIPRERFANRIKYLIGDGGMLYGPFTAEKPFWLPGKFGYNDTGKLIKYIGIEKINNYTCFHIQEIDMRENKPSGGRTPVKTECNYWINIQDFIPVQYAVLDQYYFQGAADYGFRKETLTSYQLNTLTDEAPFSISSIPSYYRLKEYTAEKPIALLPEGVPAPDWSLYTANDEKVSLSDLKGKVVLIDFFYRSCFPCMLALPTIKGLNEKYKNKGLKVIGFDSYNKKEKGIADFLKSKNVTYPVVLNGAKTDIDYHVMGYPTLYLIDKQGKVLFSKVGLGTGNKEKLEKIIEQNL